MFRKHQSTSMRRPWRLLLGLICIGLVMLSGTLSVTHTHAQGPAFHADCGLCSTAHSATQVTAPAAPASATPVITRVNSFVQAPRSRVLSRFALFTRPPPVNAHLS